MPYLPVGILYQKFRQNGPTDFDGKLANFDQKWPFFYQKMTENGPN